MLINALCFDKIISTLELESRSSPRQFFVQAIKE